MKSILIKYLYIFNQTFSSCVSLKGSFAGIDLAAATNIWNMFYNCNINVGASTANYDNTLISWAAQAVNAGLNVHFGSSKYSVVGGGQAARNILTGAPNNWTITDGGL